MSSIDQARQAVFSKMDAPSTDLSESLVMKIERISKAGTSKKYSAWAGLFVLIESNNCWDFSEHRIGGHTTEFVNRVLDKVKQGVPDGGISDL